MFESCRAHRRLPRGEGISARGPNEAFMASLPDGLTIERHRDLEGLYWKGIVFRWITLGLLVLISVLGLLNFFGQRPSTDALTTPQADFELVSPTQLRGGLIFMARFTITANEEVKDATLVLDEGWADGITINTIEPSPVGEASRNGRLALELGHIPAGETYVLFMDFQVNPTTVGRQSQNVELLDGDTHIATIERTLTVFP
jgi:hypothetical protein